MLNWQQQLQQQQQGQGQGQLQSAMGQANSPSAAAADSWGWLDEFEHKQQAERLPGEIASLSTFVITARKQWHNLGVREGAASGVHRFLPVSLHVGCPVGCFTSRLGVTPSHCHLGIAVAGSSETVQMLIAA